MESTLDKTTLLSKLASGVEGATTFKSRPESSYRFRLDAKQGKLQLWLEDKKSKNQWRTGELEMNDFVEKDCVIPHASFEDYAVCFLKCLQLSLPSDEFKRDLVPSGAKRDAWELRLVPKLRMFSSTWTPTYCLVLHPLPLEPVDLLAARVRDQEDVIEQLQCQLKQHEGLPHCFRGTTLANATSSQALVWTRDQSVGSGDVIQVQQDGSIRITTGGLFMVNVLAQHYNSNNTTTLQLLVNRQMVASAVDSSNNSHQQVTTMSYILTAKMDDVISVVYVGNGYGYAGSSILIHQLR